MKKHYFIKASNVIRRLLPFAWLFTTVNTLNAQAQPGNVIKAGGLAIGYGLVKVFGKKKKDNQPGKDTSAVSRPTASYAAADMQDINGVWEGEVSNGNTVWFYRLSLLKTGDNTYSGIDTFYLERNKNNAPIQNGGLNFAQQTFTGNFNQGVLSYSGVENTGMNNFPLLAEQLKLVTDNGNPVIINNNINQPGRKIYLRKKSEVFPDEYSKYIISKNSLQIENITFQNSANSPVLRYNDHGQITISLKNNMAKDLMNIKVELTPLEPDNGFINFSQLNGNVGIAKNSENNFIQNVSTDFSVPRDSVHFTVHFSYNGLNLGQKTIALSTDPFFKTKNISVPEYTSSRLQAVAGYYGLQNTAYSDVPKQLEPLVIAGDKMAAMWKAVFLSMGYGEYRIDEEQGYNIGKTCIKTVEDKARHGDAEAIYLMFYACEMGLEGENAKLLYLNFLQKAAMASFKPAIYDYARQFNQYKDYASAFKYLTQSYAMGVKKAAAVIGTMYENGLSVSNDNDSAVHWYKAGMSFGDPEAMLCYAKMLSKGFDNNPPDINKALTLATAATTKNYTEAMIFNGTVYFDGRQGVARNMPEAIKWYKTGAEQGDRKAMLALGGCYVTGGSGIVKDEHSGLFWIKKAAELGSPKAMLALANFYNEGTVAEKNIIAGRYWYNQAVISGYAKGDATGINAGAQNFLNFFKYADFSPSYIYVDEYGYKVADGDDGLMNGLFTGMWGAMSSYYGNQQQLIDGLEFICKRNGIKIYGGTVSSNFVSNLYLKQGQTVSIKSYGVISTGMMSGPANADGLGNAWAEYRIVQSIPCSAVMAGIKSSDWQFIGQSKLYTAPKEGPLVLALNAIDYRNYKGYFDIVIQVPEN